MIGVRKFTSSNSANMWRELRAWFSGHAGSMLCEIETERLGSLLPNLFGYHIVQLGAHVAGDLTRSTRIAHRVLMHNELADDVGAALVGNWDALPLEANSVDVLVAPHILEFASNPHAVLREAERVLIGEGYLVICGFNPWSLCGIWRLLGGWRGRAPWCGQFVSASRMEDRLELLGFEIEYFKKISFRPPLQHESINTKLEFVEALGSVLWPFFANLYIIVAKKHVPAATPLKASWKTRRRLLSGGVAEPTTRIQDKPKGPG